MGPSSYTSREAQLPEHCRPTRRHSIRVDQHVVQRTADSPSSPFHLPSQAPPIRMDAHKHLGPQPSSSPHPNDRPHPRPRAPRLRNHRHGLRSLPVQEPAHDPHNNHHRLLLHQLPRLHLRARPRAHVHVPRGHRRGEQDDGRDAVHVGQYRVSDADDAEPAYGSDNDWGVGWLYQDLAGWLRRRRPCSPALDACAGDDAVGVADEHGGVALVYRAELAYRYLGRLAT